MFFHLTMYYLCARTRSLIISIIMKTKNQKTSCFSRLFDIVSCHFVRLNKKFPFLSHQISTPPGVAKTESGESAESPESGESGESGESVIPCFKKSCASRLCDTIRCSLVRLLKHNCARLCNFQLNFHSTFSSGRFKSISRAKHGVRSRRDLNLTQFPLR